MGTPTVSGTDSVTDASSVRPFNSGGVGPMICRPNFYNADGKIKHGSRIGSDADWRLVGSGLTDWLKKKKPAEAGFFGAVEKTRTSTGCPTATSTLRVYQFRHDRIVVGVDLRRRGCM